MTVERYVRHAQRFGVDLVYETAEASGLSAADLERLRKQLGALTPARKHGGRGKGTS